MPVDLAPEIRERVKSQKTREANLRDHESWSFSTAGLYTRRDDYVINGSYPTEQFRAPNGEIRFLRGYEVFIADQIREQLASGKKRPLIILDIGGGAGGSWNNLARSFIKEVEAGDVVFVVSNLAATPEYQLRAHNLLGGGLATAPEPGLQTFMRDFPRTKNLVHYISGRVSRLGNQLITLPNQQRIPLRGNVALINDVRSITLHSLIPELDVIRATEMLAPSGIYIVPERNITAERPRYTHERIQGRTNAYNALQRYYNMTRVAHAEAGQRIGTPIDRYRIFKKPLAPAIVLN